MSIENNIKKILSKLPEDITLVAASKTRNLDEIKSAYKAGVRNFGENKVQEFIQKYDELSLDVKWHFIGHLQRNKVKYIIGKVALIHSLDSLKLLQEIEKKYKENSKICNVLIQVNIGKEKSKYGIYIDEMEQMLRECEKCDYVKVQGLMAIIPKGDDESCKMYFSMMNNLWNNIKKKNYKNVSMEYLSMGMSSDYLVAVKEGSNMIRIGEGIFGKRIYKK